MKAALAPAKVSLRSTWKIQPFTDIATFIPSLEAREKL